MGSARQEIRLQVNGESAWAWNWLLLVGVRVMAYTQRGGQIDSSSVNLWRSQHWYYNRFSLTKRADVHYNPYVPSI